MKYLTILTLILSLNSMAQDSIPCNCCSSHYNEFDFWVGEWNVYDTTGKQIGENIILELQDNCALQENWTSKNSTGTSYNYFNKSDSTWNQLWIDNQGGSLVLKGSFVNGAMRMQSELLQGKKQPYKNEIVWTENDDGSVTQQWNILNSDGDLITTVFYGIYRKKKE